MSPETGGAQDRRWPNVDRLVASQPWSLVREALQRSGVGEVKLTLQRLQRYVELLIQWNRSVSNLISKNDEARIVEAHLVPSIEPAAKLKSFNSKHWCDLGSGGGFPALPLALCGVGESWDLVESRRTKTLFLRRAIGELKLTGVRVLAARIEDLVTDATWASPARDDDGIESVNADDFPAPVAAPADDREPGQVLTPPYDGFTSRATMSLGPTLMYAAALVRPGGHAFLWKGSKLAIEAEEDPAWKTAWKQTSVQPLSVEHAVVAEFERLQI